MFDSVLIANRGEIAVRIIATLRKLGIRAVSVYTPSDTGALHASQADVAVPVTNYRDIEQIISVARAYDVDAIHPGYGFLSENPEFARAVAKAGLTFIGPSADAIGLMGDKAEAKKFVSAYGVPTIPGATGTDAELIAAAKGIGVPLLIKPAAGGGGVGMREVTDLAELPTELVIARRIAQRAFGDDTLLIERNLAQPRHIEVQILADNHGTVRHVFERECSLQRRHQKVIEEAPAPVLRDELTAAARTVATACGYRGAGTVEFLVTGNEFYFIEMNTRLQVEHPVTELVADVDLVAWQLRIAAGDRLPDQGFSCHGHAIEARIYAEDPRSGFLPTGGLIEFLSEPSGPGIRVDSALCKGLTVSSDYDPMLAKITTHGPDRPIALRRLRHALEQLRVYGVRTNASYLRALLDDPAVSSGAIHTGILANFSPESPDGTEAAQVIAYAMSHERTDSDPFSTRTGWRVGRRAPVIYRLDVDSEVTETLVPQELPFGYDYHKSVDGTWWVAKGADTWQVRLADDMLADVAAAEHSGSLTSPMPGTVISVQSTLGAVVANGDPIVTVEAMKMEHVIRAPFAGTITKLTVQQGKQVVLHELLAEVSPA